MKKALWFSKIVSSIADTAMICIGLVTLTGLGGRGMPIDPPVWLWAILSVIFCVGAHLLSRRKISVSVFALINIIFFLVFLAIIIMNCGFSEAGGGGKVLLITGVAVSAARSVFNISSIKNSIYKAIQLDVLIIFSLWFLLCSELGMNKPDIGSFVILALILSIISTAISKVRGTDSSSVESGGSGGAAIVYGASTLIVLGATFGVFAIFSRAGAVSLAGVKTALKTFFKTIGGAITRFLQWLVSLMKTRDITPPDFDPPPSYTPEEAYPPIEFVIDPLIIKIIIAAIVLIVVIVTAVLLIKNRGKKMAGFDDRIMNPTTSRKHIKGGFAIWWEGVKKQLRFEITYFKNRHTPTGVFIWLERFGRKSGNARKKGETMSEYIDRMDVNGILSPLGPELSSIYFGNATVTLEHRKCRSMKNSYKKARRRARRRKK